MNKMGKLEALGLLLLLVAFGWECFAQTLANDKTEALLQTLHQKIDVLWDCEYARFAQSEKNVTTSNMFVDLNVENHHWAYYEQIRENFRRLDEQKDTGETVRIVLYIVGSICIISSKWFNKG